MKNQTKTFLCTAALAIALASPAFAQEAQKPNDMEDWDISLGMGYALAPSYEGSGHYVHLPVPMVNIKWRDTITLGQDGLNWIAVKDGNLRGGIGLAYEYGRDDVDGSYPWNSSGSNHLRGTGDVDDAWGARVFASYNFQPVVVDGAVTQFFGDDIDGMTVKIGASVPYQHSQQLRITPGISTTWASEDYISPYFSITPAQSAASFSGLPAFDADAGFKDITASVNLMYFIDANWYALGDVRVKQLVGDAADSPVTEDETSGQLVTAIGYRF